MGSHEHESELDLEAIEARAEAVLAEVPSWLWDGRPPVPVDEIADTCHNLLVREVEDLSTAPGAPKLGEGQSLSGLLLASRGEIWINAAEARDTVWGRQRRRFTICHELGHWILHRSGQQSLFCRRATFERAEASEKEASTRPPLPITEEEANAFAAALLLPADLVRRYYERVDGDFQALCKIFHCSGAAMGRRLHAVV